MTITSVVTKAGRISLEIDGPVAQIKLCRSPLNVIDTFMMKELIRSVAEIDSRPEISIIVISGEGKAFCAGVDVAIHTPDKVDEMLNRFHTAIRALLATTKVSIAAVSGHCLGGGAELAMICDLVYTTETAQWGFPEIKLGCYPPVACAALASLVGQKRAAELILTGRTITGKEAAEIGLANRALPEDGLPVVVEEAIGHLRNLSPVALALAKKACYAWDSMHFDKGLARAERIYFDELIKTSDAQEGIRAFMEKRDPKWTGM